MPDVVALLRPFFERRGARRELVGADEHLAVLADAVAASNADKPIADAERFWRTVETALCAALREGTPRLMFVNTANAGTSTATHSFFPVPSIHPCMITKCIPLCTHSVTHSCLDALARACVQCACTTCSLWTGPRAISYVRSRRDVDGRPVTAADFSVVARLIAVLDWAWGQVDSELRAAAANNNGGIGGIGGATLNVAFLFVLGFYEETFVHVPGHRANRPTTLPVSYVEVPRPPSP